MRARLHDREPGETAIDALRAWVAGLMERVDFDDPRERCRQQLLQESEALRAHDRHLRAGVEDLLAESIAEDLGVGPDSLRARMVTAATIAAGNPVHRLRVEHDADTLLVHLSDEDGGGWTVIAVDRATRRWAVAQARRQLDAATDAYERLYRDAPR
jgi:hypothetical protein